MALILNDTNLKKLFGTVIKDADDGCIRPNSYVLRLGSHGEFLNTGKEFELGNKVKGLRIQPGHSVAITAFEKIDFSRDVVEKIFPGADLHGFLSPTTDLSREGIITSSTQVDAGYTGTLNWTIRNTSNHVAEFIYQEKLFRLTIFRLENGEKPETLYDGEYQAKDGYVRSSRGGAPRGMKESEWIDSSMKGSREEKLGELIDSGYPWNILGTRLKEVDDQLGTVANEYAAIGNSIDKLNNQMAKIPSTIADAVNKLFIDQKDALAWKFATVMFSIFLGVGGLVTLVGVPKIWNIFGTHPVGVGVALLAICIILLFTTFIMGRKK